MCVCVCVHALSLSLSCVCVYTRALSLLCLCVHNTFLQAQHSDFGPFTTHQCPLLELPTFAGFDFVQLSNVMDWMDEPSCRQLARRLATELQPGAAILWRQLNNSRTLTGYFAPAFAFDALRDTELTHNERSLFYNQVHCGIRQ